MRTCTCHSDDNPPRPCPQKYAYSDCVEAARDPLRPMFGDAITPWRDWFAWWPIRTVDGGFRWLRNVQWRAVRVHPYLTPNGGTVWFQYRFPQH